MTKHTTIYRAYRIVTAFYEALDFFNSAAEITTIYMYNYCNLFNGLYTAVYMCYIT
jgi:hypothetical protein